MPTTIAGHAVRIVTGDETLLELYWVREPDLGKAEDLIRSAKTFTSNERVEAIGALSQADIEDLGLRPGQFVPAFESVVSAAYYPVKKFIVAWQRYPGGARRFAGLC
jgi:hypothetical protein